MALCRAGQWKKTQKVFDVPLLSWKAKETLRPSLPNFPNEVTDAGDAKLSTWAHSVFKGLFVWLGHTSSCHMGWNRDAGHWGSGCCVCTLILVLDSSLSTIEIENVIYGNKLRTSRNLHWDLRKSTTAHPAHRREQRKQKEYKRKTGCINR